MIPLDIMPGVYTGRQPPDPRDVHRVLRILVGLAIVAFLLVVFFDYAYQGYYWFLVYFLLFTGHPIGAFGSIAAVIFGLGWYWRWPPILKSHHPAWRASALLATVFVLHAGWFLFGWVTFRPLCVNDTAVRMAAFYDIDVALYDVPTRALIGPLKPAIADKFEYTLTRKWGAGAVRRADAHTLLVRPAIALLNNSANWHFSYRLIDGPLPDGTSDDGCREMEVHGLVRGYADSQRIGWGLWPWSTIRDDGDFARWLRGLYKDD